MTLNPFGTAQQIEIGDGFGAGAPRVLCRRAGLGNLCQRRYGRRMRLKRSGRCGQAHGMMLCGMHMMDSCRIEKGFRHFGHDITCEDHVLEAGLGFAVKTDKPAFHRPRGGSAQKDRRVWKTRLVQFKLTDPQPMLYHNEPILRDGEIVGYLSSGAYGHHLGAAIGMGYVPCKGESVAQVLASRYEIDVAGIKVGAEASLRQCMIRHRSG